MITYGAILFLLKQHGICVVSSATRFLLDVILFLYKNVSQTKSRLGVAFVAVESTLIVISWRIDHIAVRPAD